MEKKGYLISNEDNVAVAIRPIDPKEKIIVRIGDKDEEIILNKAIDFGHKFAIKDISVSDNIIKYGEVIGKASKSIKKGDHVHIHNVESLRGRGDLERKK